MTPKKNDYNPETVTHPIEILKESLEMWKISLERFAVKIGFTEEHIIEVFNGEIELTQDFANLLGEELLVPAIFWIRLIKNYIEHNEKQKTPPVSTKKRI